MTSIAVSQSEIVDLGPFPRVAGLPEYVLKKVTDLRDNLRRQGKDIVDLGMGNPDGETPGPIVNKLIAAARLKRNHRYSVSKGILRLREQIVRVYQHHYGIELDVDQETLVTIGAKDALGRLIQGTTGPGDVIVSTNPAYPIHYFAIKFHDGTAVMLPLHSPEDFLNRLEHLLKEMAPKKPRMILVSFPHNPTTICVDLGFWEALVAMACKHGIMIVHDFAYAHEGFDEYVPPSIMQVKGAKHVAVEIYSLSKSYNMAGWRVGFAVGNKRMIGAATAIKGYMDYGIFQPIQIASVIALRDCEEEPIKICAGYQMRRNVLVDGLNRAGWPAERSRAMMFHYGRIPERCRHMGSVEFSKYLLEKAHVATAPGVGFIHGDHSKMDRDTLALGDEYVRFALIENTERLRQATRNIKRAFQGQPPEVSEGPSARVYEDSLAHD